MYSMLETIDKYIKENNIPFKSISFNRKLLPWYINKAILREMRKSKNLSFIKVAPEYQIRYDINDNIYLLVTSTEGKENFIIGKTNTPIKEKFKFTGKSEKHIIKTGCLLKLLSDELDELNAEIVNEYSDLKPMEQSRFRYERINGMLEDKFTKFVKQNKIIEEEVDYEGDLIHSTYNILSYIRYLNELYIESNHQGRSR